MQLQIEPLNVCDAACVFCPYISMKRSHRLMSMDLFHKIIDEAAGISRLAEITLTGLGETLLDPHLDERLAYVRSKLPNIKLDLFTNGTRLTVERYQRLKDAGLTILYVSLNAVSHKMRQQVMKLDDYEQVRAVLHQIIALRNAEGGPQIVVKAVGSKDLMDHGDIEEFVEEWGGMCDTVNPRTGRVGHAMVHLEGNWAGVMYPMRIAPEKACGRALNEIMVLSDGRVSLCCFDSEGEVIFGDLNTQTIREVFAGEKAVSYRLAHSEGRRQELKLCATCTAI